MRVIVIQIAPGSSRWGTPGSPGGWRRNALLRAMLVAGLFVWAKAADAQGLDTLLNRGESLLERGRVERAISTYQRAEKLAPEDPEVHYRLAIAYRELARHHTLRVKPSWRATDRHFAWLLQRDSTYRDVLVQAALAERYRGRWEKALDLAQAAIRLRPDLKETHIGVQGILRSFVTNEKRADVLRWLDAHASTYATWARAELHRRAGEFDEAAGLLEPLLAAPDPVPVETVLLTLARVEYARDHLARADSLVYRAIDGITSATGAAVLFEDAKYIVTPEELQNYRTIEDPVAYRDFFRRFWDRRNPLPGTPVNFRLAEHYRRLGIAEKDYAFEGLRSWFNNPDKAVELSFPPGYKLNQEFDDRGLVFIRLGEPQDRVRSVAMTSASNESWRYRKPDVDFHFMIDEMGGGAGNWRLVPRLSDPRMFAAREEWGGIYVELLRYRTATEYYSLQNRMAMESQKDITTGLTMDRHTWGDAVVSVEMPYLIARFRGEGGRTRLELHYSLPSETIARHLPDSLQSVGVEVGFGLQDTTGQTLASALDTTVLVIREEGEQSGMLSLPAEPGSYDLSVHLRVPDTRMVGGYQEDIEVPSFTAREMAISDLLPLEQDTTGGRRVGHVAPEYDRKEPLHIYYELYELPVGSDDMASYDVEYALTPQRRGGIFGGGSSRPALSLKARHVSSESSTIEVAVIDASQVDPGKYDLIVRVTDPATGRTVERTIALELRK